MLDDDLKTENSIAVNFHGHSLCKLDYAVDFSKMIGSKANDHATVKRIHNQKVLNIFVTSDNFCLKISDY